MKYFLPKALSYNLISPDYPPAALDQLSSLLGAIMSAEPDWAPGQAAGPVIRWFEYSHGNVGAGQAWALSMLPLVPGRPSPFYEALDNANQDGVTLTRGTGGPTSLAVVEGEVDAEWQEPGRQLLVTVAGGYTEGATVYFPLADLDAEVPASFPNRMKQTGTIESPSEEPYTWLEWGIAANGSHAPVLIDGVYYRSSCYGESGEPLLSTHWVPYLLAFGFDKVISVDAYKVIQAANAPALP